MPQLSRKQLLSLYSKLRSHFGFLNWWPAKSNDEMAIGAILTQNTSWKNVEKAIARLEANRMLSLKAIAEAKLSKVERAIRSSGFFRQKAKRLKSFSTYIVSNYGGIDSFFKRSKEPRKELLSIGGIGKETADSMLLYAGNRPIFVIDAYTRRVLSRVFGIDAERMGYEEVQRIFDVLPASIDLYKDFHAQFVELAKNYCRKKPLCSKCPVRSMCKYASKAAST